MSLKRIPGMVGSEKTMELVESRVMTLLTVGTVMTVGPEPFLSFVNPSEVMVVTFVPSFEETTPR